MSLKLKAVASLKWSFLQQVSIQLLNFCVSIVLARLLVPDDFGLMGMIYIIFSIGTVLIDSGLSTSLIRSKNIDDQDLSTVFYSNLSISLIFYLILFFSSPFIAQFYKQDVLTLLIRVQGLTLVFSALCSIQNTLLTKNINFKKLTIFALVSNFLGSVVGILLAKKGYGVWSIVLMNNFTVFVNMIMLWGSSSWRPRFQFSKQKFLQHYKFGYKITIVQFMDAVFVNIYHIVIGKLYNRNTLGYFTRADSFKKTIIFGLSTPLKSVLLPVLSNIQDDDEKLKSIYIFILKVVILVISPVLLFCIIFAEPIFVLLFTEKWNAAIPFFQIVCLSGILYPINTYIVSFLFVKGRSDLVLKIELIKKSVLVLGIGFALCFHDIYILIWSQVIFSLTDFLINTIVLKKILQYSIISQIRNVMQVFTISAIASVLIYLVKNYFLNIIFIPLASIAIGLIIFLICNIIILYIINRSLFQSVLKLLNK